MGQCKWTAYACSRAHTTISLQPHSFVLRLVSGRWFSRMWRTTFERGTDVLHQIFAACTKVDMRGTLFSILSSMKQILFWIPLIKKTTGHFQLQFRFHLDGDKCGLRLLPLLHPQTLYPWFLYYFWIPARRCDTNNHFSTPITMSNGQKSLAELLEGPAHVAPHGESYNFKNPINHEKWFIFTVVVSLGISFFAIFIRLYTKLFIIKSRGWEDCE